MKTLYIFLLFLVGCEPEMVRYCYYSCTYEGIKQTADVCEPSTKREKGCSAPIKAMAKIGEDVVVVGFDPDQEDLSTEVQVMAYVQEISGNEFVLSEPGRAGLLGGSVLNSNKELVGLIQGDDGDRMWGRYVE